MYLSLLQQPAQKRSHNAYQHIRHVLRDIFHVGDDHVLLLERARLDQLNFLLDAVRQIVVVKFLVIDNQVLAVVYRKRVHVEDLRDALVKYVVIALNVEGEQLQF